MNKENQKMNQQEKNKETIKRFYEEVMLKGNAVTASEIILENYKQHNPTALSGRDGLLAHIQDLDNLYPERKIVFHHLLAEGDFVTTHIHFILKPGERECAGMDLFRFDGDKIAEHWDVIQLLPEESMNENSMF